MKRALILLPIFLCTCVIQSFGCTTFFIHHKDQMVFGRNYDWLTGSGIICTNQQGLNKTSMKNADGPTISWISKYGSISFNQYGKEFPTGGMNEKGLVVELMWLDGTRYPASDKRPALETLQWVQYQLDNSKNVDELIASDKVVRISSSGVPLHFLVADADGNAATVEFLEGKMKVHRGNQLPFHVLTNDTYESSLKNKDHPGNNNSLERFSTACTMIEEYKSSSSKNTLIDQSFDILKKVSQADYTKWSIVYDIGNRKVYFKTAASPQIRSVEFGSFNFSCSQPSLALDLNGKEEGDISKKMQHYSDAINRRILAVSLDQSKDRVTVSEAEKESLMRYPASIACD